MICRLTTPYDLLDTTVNSIVGQQNQQVVHISFARYVIFAVLHNQPIQSDNNLIFTISFHGFHLCHNYSTKNLYIIVVCLYLAHMNTTLPYQTVGHKRPLAIILCLKIVPLLKRYQLNDDAAFVNIVRNYLKFMIIMTFIIRNYPCITSCSDLRALV